MRNKIVKATGREPDLETMRLVSCNKEEVADIIQRMNIVPIPEPKLEPQVGAHSETTELLPMSGKILI